ncbi:uncharacterized protein [Penaeus vannamei]|uniref:uncharacterized protein n=1 Tax=Penaeus vannamei TaxID=6689 RepID=UPI00387F6916
MRGVLIPLWKRKGDCWDCRNYRGITFLSIRSKIFTHILLKRICNHLLRHQRLEQSGFTFGRSTIDHILVLRVTVERCREFRHGLLIVCIKFKMVFDSSCKVWWGPVELLSCKLRSESRLCPCTNAFQYLHGLNNEHSYDLKSTLGNIKADDVAILSESLEYLVVAKKSPVPRPRSEDLGALLEPIQLIQTCSEDSEVIENFTYLGSTVHVSGLSDQKISRRIGLAAGAMNSVNKSIWRCWYICRTKLCVFKAFILSLLLYGSKTLRVSSALELRLDAFFHLARFPVNDPLHQLSLYETILHGGGTGET